ncbi:MAG: type I-C CRISPR-associated protein Cas7/Csd2 [Gammaproteobacteria bacterium]|nr:type I-C CRISPR-associated protein Cas7/Csd2 [Gammaproteobacteria bacterium]MDE0260013.1 type I-C CRISPR-associated protein Cas7/Csd2 [Gammaproteobacteria bacterium]
MTTSQNRITDTRRRHDFVLLFDITDGNISGDPDAGNLPRQDPETGAGLITDVAIKRRVRDYAAAEGHAIFVQGDTYLNAHLERAYKDEGLEARSTSRKDREAGGNRLCATFWDVRTFGAVASTGDYNCGQIRGPVQFTFARSVDPINPMVHTLTRKAFTTREKFESTSSETEMGSKATIPYGLYRAHGFVSPPFAGRTKFNASDLELLWRALRMMWDLDRSAARGLIATRGLHIFSHESELGNTPAHELFDRVRARLKDGVETPRSFRDYKIKVDGTGLPTGVSLTSLVG